MSLRHVIFPMLLFGALVAAAAPVKTEHVEASLVAERTAVEPGQTLTLALRLKIIPGWHTYWRNPGDSGEPTRLAWALPNGWSAGAMQWPAPLRLPVGPLMNYGYEGEVLHLIDVAVPVNATGTATLGAQASWLVCNPERCIPESGAMVLEVPIGAGAASPHAFAIAATRNAMPMKPDGWHIIAAGNEGGVDLKIGMPSPAGSLISPVFFPFDEGKIDNAAWQSFFRDVDAFVLSLRKSARPVGAFTRVRGVLVADGLPRAVEIDVPVQGHSLPGGASDFVLALLGGFVGGLILNLMPCVLPVLSIKILGLARDAGSHRAMRLHGTLYACGVLGSFLFLAALLLLLKALGHEIGWGFQLQSPIFVALLALLFLALALNLSGVFEFGNVLSARLADAGRTNAFLGGVLAVALASPCTAPFMGAALGYALANGSVDALLVFTALGVGMALPYLVLAWHPGGTSWLPRPGVWMVRLKQVLALPLYATVVWLGWVLGIQSGAFTTSSEWEKFSEQRLAVYAQQGRAVFVDYTAAWCVTCQVNKRLVLTRPDVELAFKHSRMALMRADWTRRDDEIARALAALSREGVPVYAIYRPGRAPQLLPEILTRDIVFTALAMAKETAR